MPGLCSTASASPITLTLNAKDDTNKIALNGGVDGVNYDVNVNTGAGATNDSTVDLASVTGATNVTIAKGIVNTTAAGIEASAGITNNAVLNLDGNTAAGTNVLASDISGTGETFILGTVDTPAGRAIIQATVETGTTGTFNNSGNITATNIVNKGTTNINGGTVSATNITNTAGTTNINSAVTTSNLVADGGNVVLNETSGEAKTSDLIGSTAVVDINNGADVKINTDSANITIDNNVKHTSGASSTLTLNGAGTTFDVAASTSVKDTDVKLTGGQLNVANGAAFTGASTIEAAANTTINAMDGASTTFNNITLGNNSKLQADIDVFAKTGDNFSNLSGANNVVLTDAQLQNLDKIVHNNTDINLKETLGVSGLTVSSGLQNKKYQAMTPIRVMEATIDNTGMMNVHPSSGRNDYKSYNPAILTGPVAAQVGGYLTQLNSYDEAFRNMDMYMLMTYEQRQAMKHRNKYALSNGIFQFDPNYNHMEQAGAWFRPYATFEKVGLKNGPRVENQSYGSFFGGDSGLRELGHGWDGMYNVYAGYNGSHQHFNGQSIYQNGGTLGVSGMAYKGNFFAGATVNISGSAGEASTTYGHDDFAMLSSGVAAKAGYNWELANGKFIIQPSYQMSYSFVNTFDYKTASGVKMHTKPLNAIQMEPGIKFIGNFKNGWQPYAGVSVVWNIMDKTNFKANNIALPEMSVKPYVKYGVGVRKAWGEKVTGFLQAYMTNGGRNGVGLQGGFRFAIGKDPIGSITKKSSVPVMKPTKVSLQSMNR